jgi:hypothetical protein
MKYLGFGIAVSIIMIIVAGSVTLSAICGYNIPIDIQSEYIPCLPIGK